MYSAVQVHEMVPIRLLHVAPFMQRFTISHSLMSENKNTFVRRVIKIPHNGVIKTCRRNIGNLFSKVM